MTIDRDNARALIAEGREFAGNRVDPAAMLMHRFADALESALSAVPVEGAIAEIKDRLTSPGYADSDRARIALLHIEALESGRAVPVEGEVEWQASRKVEVTDEMVERADRAFWAQDKPDTPAAMRAALDAALGGHE